MSSMSPRLTAPWTADDRREPGADPRRMLRSHATSHSPAGCPRSRALFSVIKVITTGVGETISDFLGQQPASPRRRLTEAEREQQRDRAHRR
jgi:hypothetical protein